MAGPIPNNANSLTINKVFLTSATGANTTTASYTLTNPVTLKSGQSATILIPNVACNSANIHYSLSAKIQYSYDVPTIGMQTINTTGTVAGTSITGKPSTLTSYEPITITNTQSSATSSPFQQMINFTSSDPGFSSIATGNFGQNVEFFYYNGTVIPSWLENYTSTNGLWWLKIAAIPGGSSETVYVGFAPTSISLFNTVNDGEAPQLSSTYAEYDDGANIFTYYQRWGGLSALPTDWSSASGTVIIFNSDYTEIAPPASTAGWYGIYLNPIPSSLSSTTTIWELYGNYYDGTNAGQDIGTAGGSPINTNGYSFVEGDSPTNLIYEGNQFDTGYDDTNVNKIYGMVMASSTSLTMTINYNPIFTATTATAEAPTYFDIAPSNNGGSDPSTGIYVYWIRTRSYPPNGVMPSVSFGSVA